MSVLTISTLTDGLRQYGAVAQVVDGELKVKLPQNLPAEAKSLLKELKKAMDQEKVYRLFESASIQASETFSPQAWDWAKASRPELVDTILVAEQEFNNAYRAQDFARCQVAVERYKQGFAMLNEAYKQREPDP